MEFGAGSRVREVATCVGVDGGDRGVGEELGEDVGALNDDVSFRGWMGIVNNGDGMDGRRTTRPVLPTRAADGISERTKGR